MGGLDGRVALVTGAARGIGAEIAVQFARAGARVGVLDLNLGQAQETVEAITASGGSALALAADVAAASQVEEATQQLIDAFGQVDIAVNNAGVTRDNLLFKITDEDWDEVVRVNLRGTFLVTRTVQQRMVARRYGRIINLSSASALGNRGHANYSAAKAGIQGLTRTAAIELGPFGITVNAIAPGYVDTPMTHAVARRSGLAPGELMTSVAAELPVRRVGQPGDIAHAALYFAAEESGYVTGQVLYVDGGRTLP